MITQQQFARYSLDPAAFRADLVVDVDGICKRFGSCMDEWQRRDFAALDPALMRANGRRNDTDGNVKMRAYLERGRGHSKTTDLAITCIWALVFSSRPIRGYAYAADKDQSNLLRQAMATIIRMNPWIGQLLSVENHRVVVTAKNHPGEGGTLSIEASDVGSSYGILPDLVVADELVHWEGDGSLWHSIISSAAKRKNCLLVIISNAGFVDSWQWGVREAARTDEAWYFSRLEGPVASWLTEKRLTDTKRLLPLVAWNRLFGNQWSSGGGDALTEEDIKAAFDDSLHPMTGKEEGYLFVAAMDLGLTRDCSAVVVLGVRDGGMGGRIRLAHHRLWRPIPGKTKVNLLDVERHILDLDEQYNLEYVAFDPWQAESMAQRIEADSGHKRRNSKRRYSKLPFMREIPPLASNLRSQATMMIESFTDRRLSLFPCEPLKSDLLKLRVEEKSYGIRLSSPRDGTGHGDSASAFSLALLVAHEVAGKRKFIPGGWTRDTASANELLENRRKSISEMSESEFVMRQAISALGGYKRLI